LPRPYPFMTNPAPSHHFSFPQNRFNKSLQRTCTRSRADYSIQTLGEQLLKSFRVVLNIFMSEPNSFMVTHRGILLRCRIFAVHSPANGISRMQLNLFALPVVYFVIHQGVDAQFAPNQSFNLARIRSLDTASTIHFLLRAFRVHVFPLSNPNRLILLLIIPNLIIAFSAPNKKMCRLD